MGTHAGHIWTCRAPHRDVGVKPEVLEFIRRLERLPWKQGDVTCPEQPRNRQALAARALALPAAAADRSVEEMGSGFELIDLRFLDRASLDWHTVGDSIKKTNAVLIVEQGAQGTSYGGWLADEVQRRFFDWLDQPVQRVTGSEASPSISRVLERAAIARTEEVAAGLERVRTGFGRAG